MRDRISSRRKLAYAIACASLALTLIPAKVALGEPPPSDGEYAADVIIRGAIGDALLGDSGPMSFYSTGNAFSRLIDRAYVDAEGYADQFLTKPLKPRYFKIQTPNVNGGKPLNCPSGNGYVSIFSWSTPHWINDVGVGSSAVGNAYISCFLDKGQTRGWLITYPTYSAECLLLTNLGDPDFDGRAEWSFSADGTCPAAVYWREKKGGSYQKTQVGPLVPAPFEVRIEVKP